MVCILDYGSGNVKSVYNILKYLGFDVIISNDEPIIKESSHIILPGVGSYGESMRSIKKHIPINILSHQVNSLKKPFLGICVGMQVLSEKGYEFGEFNGLGWIKGNVIKLDSKKHPLPHIGWNDIQIINESPILKDIDKIKDFYFVHSYCFDDIKKENVVAQTTYGKTFNSIIQKDNIYGVQFHPEKSQKLGMLLLKNFLDIK